MTWFKYVNVFVLNDFFAKLVHGVSKSAVSAARILMDLLGWFLMVPPPKKKHETYQIFRIFLLDLNWLWLFSVVFRGSRIVPPWGDDFEESGSWVTWHWLAMGPHDMVDRAKAEQVDGQIFGNPVPQAMNHVNHWGILCANLYYLWNRQKLDFFMLIFLFPDNFGPPQPRVTGVFQDPDRIW